MLFFSASRLGKLVLRGPVAVCGFASPSFLPAFLDVLTLLRFKCFVVVCVVGVVSSLFYFGFIRVRFFFMLFLSSVVVGSMFL